jgi:hypothetical protein
MSSADGPPARSSCSRLLVAGVGPPVVRRLAWPWDHPGHQDQQVHRQSVAHQRCGEAAERLGHHDQVGAVPDGVDHRVALGLRPALFVCAVGALLSPLPAVFSPLRQVREQPVSDSLSS